MAEAGVRFIYQQGDAPPVGAAKPAAGFGGDAKLRVLAVFSLPSGENPLNLRRERVELERLLARLAQVRGAAVELRVLQYGATRETLKEALAEGAGWDLLHLSGHGLEGQLVLEDEAGAADVIDTAELSQLLQPGAPASDWTAWAAAVPYRPEIEPAGPCVDGYHRTICQKFTHRFQRFDRHWGFGVGMGSDFVMRLGDDAFTPDALLVRYDRLDGFLDYYFDGAAALVIEVLMPGKDPARDRDWKRRRFERAGVLEYWIVDPEARTVEFLRHTGEGYRQQMADEDGCYRPLPFFGLAFAVDELWERSRRGPFYVETRLSDSECEPALTETPRLPFAPRIDLVPTPIRFVEFISWCPEAKTILEIDLNREAKQWIVGMLLMTFGLTGAVDVLEPRRWVQALTRNA